MKILGSGVAALVLIAVVAGCSSGHPAATRSPASTSTTSARRTTASTVTPKQAAIAFAQRMLADAVLPPGARPSKLPPPPLLRGPFEQRAITNLVHAHQLWVVPGEAHAIAEFFQAHWPTGYVTTGGIGSSTSPEGQALEVVDYPSMSPPNLVDAALEFGVLDGAAGLATVRVDAVVGWTAPRPDDEFVPERDRVVIVTALHGNRSIARRVVVTDPSRVQQIVQVFNALVVSPGGVRGCTAVRLTALSYRVAFAASRTARPDIVATFAACSDVGVTVNGKSSLSLGTSGFPDAVATAIGNPDLHLFG